MNAAINNIGVIKILIFGIFFYYLLPFITSIVLPAIIIPFFVKLIVTRKQFNRHPSIKSFVLFLVAGGIIATLLWHFFLQDDIYHVWDSLLVFHYSFFGFEHPSFGLGYGWLAKGWKIWYLDLLWVVATISVYVCAAFLAWYKNRKSSQLKEYKKVLLGSVLGLILVTMIFPKVHFLNFNWFPINVSSGVNTFEEKNLSCPKTISKQPRILYWFNAENGEVVSDLDGKNQNVAFEKDVQLRGRMAIFSPDETKVVSFFALNEYWIMCTYSHGATRIPIPAFKIPYVNPSSIPSWSPDSKRLVLNLHGDLAIVDTFSKKIETVKKNVAIRDNHIDLTSQYRNTKIPAYEVGTAYWARDGLIYYSSFEGKKTLLHRYNLSDKSDKVIYVSQEVMSIKSGDPTGRYLLINLYRVNEDRSFYDFGRDVIFDTKDNREVAQYDGDSIPHTIWSPSGKYFVDSNKNWYETDGKIIASATYVNTMDHSQDVNISALVEEYFAKEGKLFRVGSLFVEAIDFIDEDQIIVHIIFPDSVYNNSYALANLIVNFKNKEVKLLQDYPRGQDTGKELFPLKVLHP